MILIADSGSTKTDWTLMQSQGTDLIRFASTGLNPNVLSDGELTQQIRTISVLRDHADDIKSVYFYGAGCTGKDNIMRVTDLLNALLPGADVHVDSDMVGAVRAVCDHKPCITAILGTGANSCYFDGTLIHGLDFSIGYVLGDEGSGAWLGKQLLRAISYDQLPEPLLEKCRAEFDLTREAILHGVYKTEAPSAFLASFAPFVIRHAEHPFMQGIISEGLHMFVQIFLKRFAELHQMPVHFIGSIAVALEQHITALCRAEGIHCHKFLRSPMEGLIQYHLRDAGILYGKDEII